jgi:hypothetical protein
MIGEAEPSIVPQRRTGARNGGADGARVRVAGWLGRSLPCTLLHASDVCHGAMRFCGVDLLERESFGSFGHVLRWILYVLQLLAVRVVRPLDRRSDDIFPAVIS